MFCILYEPVPDPLLSPFVCNVSAPNSSGTQPGEGFSSSASDISSGKGYDPSFHMYLYVYINFCFSFIASANLLCKEML